ncbi:LysE family translocator [Mesorhizobium sp. BR1-1-2]|uniref:LysE family translocator n=1 Tax=Mesorhizobium sp. BR1-1-2 TaxID=2876652 RepID=UPI001CCBDE2C|nr:LysE family translocator [Mesorhizobium sp. BR1-1-2]MBZ9964115.1 LysE family translocator [Mesorhizobium sp. BR1-1-2]
MAGSFFSQPDLWRQLAALMLAAMVVMGSPGPATISVTAVGAAFGLRHSLSYALGVIVGTIAVLLVVASGMSAMLAAMPRLAPLLVVASAAYILYLAYRIATAPPLAAHAGEAARPTFAGGFLLAVANPKAYVAIAAVFAGASVDSGAGGIGTGLTLTALAFMIVAIHAVWLLAGAAFARFLRRPVASRIINLVFAATLVLTTALAVFA